MLSPVDQYDLKVWVEEFYLPLREFSLDHIRAYEQKRLLSESCGLVNGEVSTLLRLLEAAGVGEEIRRDYEPLRDPEELSRKERGSLPEQVLKYIEKLECEIRSLDARNDRTENRLRKANWARWNR